MRFKVLLFTLLLVCLPTLAVAGTVDIKDDAGVFADVGKQAVLTAAARWPLHLRVVTTLVRTQAEMQEVARLGSGYPRTLCVVIQPEMRLTSTRWSDGIRIRAGDWPRVYRAGEFSFREGKWADGVIRIADAALKHGTWSAKDFAEFDVEPPPGPLREDGVTAAQVFVGVCAALLLIALLVIFFGHRRSGYGSGYSSTSVLFVNSCGGGGGSDGGSDGGGGGGDSSFGD